LPERQALVAALTRVEQAVNFGSYQVAQSSVTAFFAGTGGDFDPTAHRDEWIKNTDPFDFAQGRLCRKERGKDGHPAEPKPAA